LIGLSELPSFFLLPLIGLAIAGLAIAGLAIARRSGFDLAGALSSHRRTAMILAAPALGAVLVGGLLGKHWGYRGRMPYFAFPPTLLFGALMLSAWVNAQRTRFRVRAAVGLFVGAIATSMVGFPSGALAAALEGGAFGVTPHTYADSGRIFRHFISAAGLPRATILTSDVGGLALCCDELQIVDLGLLSNRQLAHRGPLALEKVLEAESPELVEAHWQWASSGKLYELPYFQAHYVPAFGGRTKLWIRRDVADDIERNGQGCWVAVGRGDLEETLRTHRYADHDSPEDRRRFELPGTVFVLDSTDASAASLCK
jgi:hypothetical protein